MLSRCFFDFSVGVGAFVIGLSQISSFFSFNRSLSNLVRILIMTREGAVYLFMSEGQRSR